jgi:hypothetical protein
VETVRLDVDGWYPQMMASGSFTSDLSGYVEWAAEDLNEIAPGTTWSGSIGTRSGDEFLLPQKSVKIEVKGGGRLIGPSMTITFSGDSGPVLSRQLQYASPFFRTADVEWDTVLNAVEVTSFNTGSRADRPPSVPVENLTIVEVFSRAGVDLRTSASPLQVPTFVPGFFVGEMRWSDAELEDVMKLYWSRYKSEAQWAFWFLFAGLHENPDYRGIMFDHFDGHHKRRGGAVFNDWWTTTSEPWGPDHTATNIHRRRFVTACHETGHCFDLIHSDEHAADSLGWWTLGDEPLALSFMNNPEKSWGAKDFFDEFEYRFSDRELGFIRHAPELQVEMGGPYYGDSYADRAFPSTSGWNLQISVAKAHGFFDFLEPVILDLALTNTSDRPQVIDEGILRDGHNLAVAVRTAGGAPAMLRPYAIACIAPVWRTLQPGESVRHSVFASAGTLGWLISEPGPYEIRAFLNTASVKAKADTLRLRVATPRSREEEVIAQDFFTDDVGRTLAFGGSSVRDQANATLERVAGQMSGRPLARHAQLALGLPKLKPRKQFRLPEGERPFSSVAADGGSLVMTKPEPEEGRRLVAAALAPGDAMSTFGVEFAGRMMALFSQWEQKQRDSSAADTVPAGKRRARAKRQS